MLANAPVEAVPLDIQVETLILHFILNLLSTTVVLANASVDRTSCSTRYSSGDFDFAFYFEFIVYHRSVSKHSS